MMLERVGWVAVRATDHALPAGVAACPAWIRFGGPCDGAAADVPSRVVNRAGRTGSDARSLDAPRARVEPVGWAWGRDRERDGDGGTERDPRSEDRVDEDADQAPPPETGAFREAGEGDGFRRKTEGVEDGVPPADRALDHETGVVVERIRRRLVSGMPATERPVCGPERAASVADHDDCTRARDARAQCMRRWYARVVCLRRRRADQVEAVGRERPLEVAHQHAAWKREILDRRGGMT